MAVNIGPTRVYVEAPRAVYRRLLWFRNHRPNEMLMGVYGLTGKPAILEYEFPEYELQQSELGKVQYRYGEAAQAGVAFDHITCHADGRIHVKTRTTELYAHRIRHTQPLGANTSTFLRFIVLTDLVSKYGMCQWVLDTGSANLVSMVLVSDLAFSLV